MPFMFFSVCIIMIVASDYFNEAVVFIIEALILPFRSQFICETVKIAKAIMISGLLNILILFLRFYYSQTYFHKKCFPYGKP